MNTNWNLPPGVSLRDIDPRPRCRQCGKADNMLDDKDLCMECRVLRETYRKDFGTDVPEEEN